MCNITVRTMLLLSMIFSGIIASAENRIAILVGVNEYDDPGILKLGTPRNDATDLGTMLGNPGSGWDKVFVMTDDKEYRSPDFPSRNKINQRMALVAGLVTPEDTVMLFFSGHGITDERGDEWFLPVDTVFNDWRNTAIRLSGLVTMLREKGVTKIIMVVDACRESVSLTKGLSVVGVGGAASGGNKIRELLDQAEKALAQAPQITVEVMHRQFLFALRTRDTAKARKLAAAINKHPQISLYSYVLDDLKAKGY